MFKVENATHVKLLFTQSRKAPTCASTFQSSIYLHDKLNSLLVCDRGGHRNTGTGQNNYNGRDVCEEQTVQVHGRDTRPGCPMKNNSLALELSSVPKGFSPPLQISHSVVPKLHLSAAKLRLAESPMHSGGTQGILSMRTEHAKIHGKKRGRKSDDEKILDF